LISQVWDGTGGGMVSTVLGRDHVMCKLILSWHFACSRYRENMPPSPHPRH
jgi:hypothetical protein